VANCYQEIGAFGARFYLNMANSSKFGIITFVDQDKLLNLQNLLHCVSPMFRDVPQDRDYASARQGMQICGDYYVTQHGMNTIHVAYIGSTPHVCADFCRNLQGCRK
jgi:hypothetical protein